MREDLRERREETWRRLVVNGQSYGTVVDTIASEYDISKSGVESDIGRMNDWIGDLDEHDTSSGISRIRELRRARQRLQQMALEARKDTHPRDPDEELDIQKQIVWMLKQDVELAQSVGMTPKEPDQHEVKHAVANVPSDDQLDDLLVDVEDHR